MATITAAYATERHPWKIAVVMWTTAVVLWIAHLYAHGLSESLSEGHRLNRHELSSIAGRESGIMLAVVAPGIALVLGAIGVFAENVAVWLALGICLATLAAEGIRYARLERLGPAGTLVALASNLALGLLVVALKVAVSH